MLFNSIQFVIFFAMVTAACFAFAKHARWILLVASCYFYMVFVPEYILVLFFLILTDYVAGILIERSVGHRRKQILIISLIANIGTLAFFKYFNFFNGTLASIWHLVGWNYPISNHSLLLPIGLSFHTFQSMSYTIEVYRGHQRAEKNLSIYALYVLFYPQMVAGPIERPQNLLHQFYGAKSFDYHRVADGIKLMAWGLFKKIVIADRLALLVNSVYNDPGHHTGWPLVQATYFFAFQIYCDFSGYSDIAIGAAQVMGFKLMDNFNRPYHSKSISEFWRRWHISLSTWFRDYLYISLGGNRVVKWRWYFNLFFVFLISGLWHGANWTFVIWGTLHGSYLICSIWTAGLRARFVQWIGLIHFPTLHKFIQVFVTFHLVTFAWIFFRANSTHDAFFIIRHLFSPAMPSSAVGLGLDRHEILLALIFLALMELVHLIQRRGPTRNFIGAQPAWLRWAIYSGFALVILLFGEYTSQDFIYFQF